MRTARRTAHHLGSYPSRDLPPLRHSEGRYLGGYIPYGAGYRGGVGTQGVRYLGVGLFTHRAPSIPVSQQAIWVGLLIPEALMRAFASSAGTTFQRPEIRMRAKGITALGAG